MPAFRCVRSACGWVECCRELSSCCQPSAVFAGVRAAGMPPRVSPGLRPSVLLAVAVGAETLSRSSLLLPAAYRSRCLSEAGGTVHEGGRPPACCRQRRAPTVSANRREGSRNGGCLDRPPASHSPPTTHLSPVTTHFSPLTSDPSPLISHLSSLTTHHSPLAPHLPPPTSHFSPLTSHLSPLTAHRPKGG